MKKSFVLILAAIFLVASSPNCFAYDFSAKTRDTLTSGRESSPLGNTLTGKTGSGYKISGHGSVSPKKNSKLDTIINLVSLGVSLIF